MKLGIESAALLIFFICLWTALKSFIHLRNDVVRRRDDRETHTIAMEQRRKLGRIA